MHEIEFYEDNISTSFQHSKSKECSPYDNEEKLKTKTKQKRQKKQLSKLQTVEPIRY